MSNKLDKNLIFIIPLSIATLLLNGCASSGYQRVCDWCDDASQLQLKKDIAECNAMANNQVPDRLERRKTGRIITSHGSTSCTTNKKGDTTCSTGSSYTYPEEETIDVTNYQERRTAFDKCADARVQNYRPKVATTKPDSNQASSTTEDNYNWDLTTLPEKIEFTWTENGTGSNGKTLYISANRNSIQVNRGRRVFWVLQNYENTEVPNIRSATMQMELDCLEHKTRLLIVYGFSEPMGKGELIAKMRIANNSPGGAWKTFSPSESRTSRMLCVAM